MPKILFRADADIKSGTGNLLSLIYISEYFKGWRTYFITKETQAARDIYKENKIQDVQYIPYNITIGEEINFLNNFIRKIKADVSFFEITTMRLTEYKDVVAPFKVCVNFDGVIPPNFDLVVNWDVGTEALYDKRRYPFTSFLIGPQYVFLRKQILERANRYNSKAKKRKKVKNVLVFFGGFDKFDLTLKIIKCLEDTDTNLNLNAILGTGYNCRKKLKDYLDKSKFCGYSIKQNIRHMDKEYKQADLIITSGGLSLFEAVALKIPVCVVAVYEHQIKRGIFFEEAGIALYLGFRKCNIPKLRKAITGYRFRYFKGTFLADTIPGIINERFGYKR